MQKRNSTLGLVIAVLVLVALACGSGGADPTPVVLAPPTDPPPPPALQTAEAAATQVAIGLVETQGAGQTDAQQATAQAELQIVPIRAELESLGLDPQVGQLGWIHPPEALEVEGYLQYDYFNRFLATLSTDVVMATDITWNTFTGLSGCGFMIHANGDEESLDGFMVVATRAGNGRVTFLTLEDGEVVEGVDVSVRTTLDWRNDATNRLAVVVRGNEYTIFTNGTNIGTVTPLPEYQYDRGFSAMVNFSESGRTFCEFNNTWLWQLP